MKERAAIVFDTPYTDIAKAFNVSARVTHVGIPKDLYDAFIRLYNRSHDMHEKILLVLNDGEHILGMEEGRGDFRLPKDDFLEKPLADLNRALKKVDPYRQKTMRNGYVGLKPEQIQNFFDLFSKDYDVVSTLFDALRRSDYLRYHRHLRDVQKIRYAGPTSLQEIFDVYIGLARAHRQQTAYLEALTRTLKPKAVQPQLQAGL